MKKIASILLILFLLLFPVYIESVDAADEALLIEAILPTGSFEGVVIKNYGDKVDLRDYYITDTEGKITFTESLTIEKNETIGIFKTDPDKWVGVERYVIFGTSGVVAKSFALNDDGDDIRLVKADSTVDAFVYGNYKNECDGWSGKPFDKVPKNSIAIRLSPYDTDTSVDWKVSVPGRTEMPLIDSGFLSVVTPFVFPDSCGDPLFKALGEAKKEVSISVYNISHPKIIGLLLSLISAGVKVNILSEGAPAGGITENEIVALSTLEKSGADVRYIVSDDGFKRYTYLHCKYAVIDSSTVAITSENWVESSFVNNRGWGAIVISEDYAHYMKVIFDADFSNKNVDIKPFRDVFPTALIEKYNDHTLIENEYPSFDAIVIPCISPDNTYDSMRELIGAAKTRVFSEQLDVQYSWVSDDDNPISWMIDAGQRGVDSRLIVDVTFDNPNDADVQDGYGVQTALDSVDGIVVKTVDNILVHNKGVIADETVWIGSVNWTYNSFMKNREVAAIIMSKDVSDYYASFFLVDWGSEYCGEVILSVAETDVLVENRPFMLDASETITSDGSEFCWDTNNDGSADRWGQKIALSLPAGHHRISLIVKEKNGEEHSMEIGVNVGIESQLNKLSGSVKYLPLILICVIIIGVKVIKGSKGGNGTDKGIQRGGRR